MNVPNPKVSQVTKEPNIVFSELGQKSAASSSIVILWSEFLSNAVLSTPS